MDQIRRDFNDAQEFVRRVTRDEEFARDRRPGENRTERRARERREKKEKRKVAA